MHRTFCFLFVLILFTSRVSAEDRYIITPIPKAGSHLLMRCLTLLTDKKVINILGGSLEDFQKSLDKAEQENAILKCHLFSGNFASAMFRRGYKNIFMCRDPRDACVSLVFYLDKMPGQLRDFFWVCEEWDYLSFDEKLMSVMTGSHSASYLLDWYQRMSAWSDYPGTLVLRFEDLIGPRGGGSLSAQKEAILLIKNFIGIESDKTVLDELYDAGPRLKDEKYLPGSIGNWKYFFNEQHTQTFKENFNHLLLKYGYENNIHW